MHTKLVVHQVVISLVSLGHAMFSHKDLPLEAETLEYGWLIQLTVGDIKVCCQNIFLDLTFVLIELLSLVN